MGSATLLNDFQVQVAGTVGCVAGDSYVVTVDVLQRGPAQTLRSATAATSGVCATTGTVPWAVTVTGGPFGPRKALVQAVAFVCGVGCASDRTSVLVKLRRA